MRESEGGRIFLEGCIGLSRFYGGSIGLCIELSRAL